MAYPYIFKNLRKFSSSMKEKHCRLLVVGGGTGGTTMTAKFAPKLGKDQVVVIEPQEVHYYQPLWTLVGAGLKNCEESWKLTSAVLHPKALWVKDAVDVFDPTNNCVYTKGGLKVSYEFLIVSMGLKINFNKIPGLVDALNTPGVCSNYTFETVNKTFEALKHFQGGNAIFTQPNTPVKCAGAPQKILYLADAYLRKVGKRDVSVLHFLSGMGAMFSVPLYSASLVQVAKKKDIQVQLQHNLVNVNSDKKEATFENLASTLTPKEKVSLNYELLHVTPPMSPPEELQRSPLVDQSGFLTINKETLQHTKFENIFGIGDCTNLPTSKTAAAIAGQCGVLRRNLKAFMAGKSLPGKYNGYTSCPLLTNYGSCIMAEFDYNLKPLETFPFDQSQERTIPYYLKKNLMGPLYWNLMLKGYWEGPALLRKILHFGKV